MKIHQLTCTKNRFDEKFRIYLIITANETVTVMKKHWIHDPPDATECFDRCNSIKPSLLSYSRSSPTTTANFGNSVLFSIFVILYSTLILFNILYLALTRSCNIQRPVKLIVYETRFVTVFRIASNNIVHAHGFSRSPPSLPRSSPPPFVAPSSHLVRYKSTRGQIPWKALDASFPIEREQTRRVSRWRVFSYIHTYVTRASTLLLLLREGQ